MNLFRLSMPICAIVGLLGGALLLIGNIDLIKALSTIGAIPFVPILILQIVALFIALRADQPEA